ncbi:hypothetical protein R3P38DRAFT_2780632 [Favolaschia claudopus]|uniref:Uncharacterized protein n=1 Tax=Favolaschia claudopus TaxID=2862362 RepID=A0AAW0B9E2_9AGAR
MLAARSTPEREKCSKLKGRMARVNKTWKNLLYATGELWDTVFVHFCMDLEHVRLICDLAGRTTDPTIVHVSTEEAEETDADNLPGCESMQDLVAWAMLVGPLLSPVVAQAKSMRVDCAEPQGLFLLLSAIGTQHALDLQQLKCYAMVPHSGNFNYLQPVQSQQLRQLSISRINPIGLAPVNNGPNLLHGITVLRLFYIANYMDWDQMIFLLRSCSALEDLDVEGIACNGILGNVKLTLPHLRSLCMELSDRGCAQLASILSLPNIATLTVRGETDAPWRQLVIDFGEVIRKIRQCCICTFYYTGAVKDFIGELHSARLIDIRTGHGFLTHLTRAAGPGFPSLENLKRWIVPSDLTYSQANILFGWPGSNVDTIYEATKEKDEDRFVEWKRTSRGHYTVGLINDEPYFE